MGGVFAFPNLAFAVFAPSDISGLQLWLKADSLSLSDNDPVAAWTDSSGSGNNMAQSDSSMRPIYKTNILNGQPVVRFDGVDDYLVLPSSVGISTLFLVIKHSTGTGDYQHFVGSASNGIGGYPWHGGSGTSLLYNLTVPSYVQDGSGWVDGVSIAPTSILKPTTFSLITLEPTQASIFQAIATWVPQNAQDRNFNGDYAEIIAYNSTLSTTDRQSVETYLGAKYGITVPDTTSPVVSLTTPSSGTVAGNVSLVASASDNIGVSGVQFKLSPNTNIGAEDTVSTYGVTWDSTAVADGSHDLVAVARDAAGNYATSTAVTVTVDNTAPVITDVSSGTPTQIEAIITWTTGETSTSTVEYGLTSSYTATSTDDSYVTSHSITLTSLTAGTTYHYRVSSSDAVGNISYSSDQTFTTEATPVTQGKTYGSYARSRVTPTPYTIPVLTSQTFKQDLFLGVVNPDVKALQKYLNLHGFPVSSTGAGSPGHETETFGSLTRSALAKFQYINGIKPAVGYFGPLTRKFVDSF